jgi:hypothetical protein
MNKPKTKLIVKHLNNGESVRRTALLSKCSTGLVQKVLRTMKSIEENRVKAKAVKDAKK